MAPSSLFFVFGPHFFVCCSRISIQTVQMLKWDNKLFLQMQEAQKDDKLKLKVRQLNHLLGFTCVRLKERVGTACVTRIICHELEYAACRRTQEKTPKDVKFNVCVSVVMIHKYWVQFETSSQVFLIISVNFNFLISLLFL
jgi:hypothetical protein